MSSRPALPGKKQSVLSGDAFFFFPLKTARFEQTYRRLILRLHECIDPLRRIRSDQVARGKQDQFPAPALAPNRNATFTESTALSPLIGIAPRPPVRRPRSHRCRLPTADPASAPQTNGCVLPTKLPLSETMPPAQPDLAPTQQQLAIVLPYRPKLQSPVDKRGAHPLAAQAIHQFACAPAHRGAPLGRFHQSSQFAGKPPARNSLDVPAFTAMPNSDRRSAVRRCFPRQSATSTAAPCSKAHTKSRLRRQSPDLPRPSMRACFARSASRAPELDKGRRPPAKMADAGCRFRPPKSLPSLRANLRANSSAEPSSEEFVRLRCPDRFRQS